MLDSQSHIDSVIDTFIEIVKSENNDEFDSPLEYAEHYLPYFQSGDCEYDDQYLNDIFCATECGGSKYLFPDLKVELGVTVYKKMNDTFVSWDYLKGFADVLKNVIAHPEQWQNNKQERINEMIKSNLYELPEKARRIRTERLRTKRMARNPDIPVANIRSQQEINRQLQNVYSIIEPNSRIANKPSFTDIPYRRGVTRQAQKKERTAINRLPSNDPRDIYLRLQQINKKRIDPFTGEYVGVNIDPFETGAIYPPSTPNTTEDILVTRGSGIKGAKFYEELRSYGINPDDYLKKMKKWAKASGYDEKQLTLDNNDKNKLRIMTEQGTKHFGRVGYKDYYIYKHLEKKKEVKKGYADKMRDRFRKSHGAISKKRKLGRNSANELSLRILWHEKDDEGRKD
jgi:hypothetical protein